MKRIDFTVFCIFGVIIVLSDFLVFAAKIDASRHWALFKKVYKRSYNDVEDASRLETFVKNLELITRHNIEADLGLHSFWLEINRFADLTNDEYRQYLGYDFKDQDDSGNVANNTYFANPWEIPPQMDWRHKNVVSSVKDQGECSSSWAFAAISSVESQYALSTGSLVPLSEQQVTDCSHDFGNDGCSGGGLMHQAMKYMKAAGGVDSRENYPYHGEDSICRFTRQNVTAKVAGFVTVLEDELVLKDAVANVGPIAAAIDAGSQYFQFYSRGIFDHDDCQKEKQHLNHAVTIIGYGAEYVLNDTNIEGKNVTEYWLIKNSWGRKWGDEGYMKIARNRDNLCGIASDALYPLMQNF